MTLQHVTNSINYLIVILLITSLSYQLMVDQMSDKVYNAYDTNKQHCVYKILLNKNFMILICYYMIQYRGNYIPLVETLLACL